jgi:hypothetical protein
MPPGYTDARGPNATDAIWRLFEASIQKATD